ncbi:hypothetical protein QJS10_CPA05g02390 [Acorus calamus]|uniref:Uncharacterized protein n=1 Tax=Acorus calamus TaxID=4465 RepID=A0AAV9EW13_ACOCL|nr:hypothetical protein QJS10_CPA05g02390 [Acorus calamus]
MGLELVVQLPPVKTSVVAVVDDNEECQTPTSEDHVLRPATVCPPAPRKRRRRAAAKRNSEIPLRDYYFAVPPDLTSVFVALPNPSKKIKVG